MSKTTSKTPTDFFTNGNFSELLGSYSISPVDMKIFWETQRKNIQALSEAQKTTFEGMQALAQRQTEILSQIVENNSAYAKEVLGEGTPEEKIAKNAEMFKTAYEKSINNIQEISDLISKSNQNASNIINKRVSASVNELKSAIKKKDKKAA